MTWGLSVVEVGVYRGPHLHGSRPMVRIRLDLGTLEGFPTDRLPGFTDALLGLLPGLADHGCSRGHPGGLVERMREGTWLGHVIEHVALELQRQAGADTTRGKTRSVRGKTGVYDVMFVYADAESGRLAGRLAVELVSRLLPSDMGAMEGLDRIAPAEPAERADEAIAAVRRLLRRNGLGPSTAALAAEARRRGIPVARLNAHSLLQLGWGARQRRLRASVTDRTGLVAAESAGDKSETKALLSAIGIPVARGAVVTNQEAAIGAMNSLRTPVVVKPLDGNHGRGVTTGISDAVGLRAAFDEAAKHGRRVVVEEQLPGRDHRILVVDGQVVAVAERVPARVIGDGVSTVRSLVETVNADPRRGEGHECVMTRIRLDAGTEAVLAGQGLTLDAVPAKGREVFLRTTGNLSTGGTAIDRTDEIHPANAAIARRAALAVGLDVAGIDFLSPDITRPVAETGGGIVEVNAAPGLRMHLQPSEGKPRDVARPIVASLFPPGARSRIPIIAVTGTNGKSTVGRMVAHILKSEGKAVGLTNTSGIYIDEARIAALDASGPRSARLVLRDPTVEVAVLECARGGLLREGLAFDSCDVGAVLNVQPDHLGLKGIDSLDDLARVKSVVTESVARRGVSVLNADDPLTIGMARHAGGRIGWFTLRGGDATPGFLLRHIGEGGLAVVYDEATRVINLHDRGASERLLDVRMIPATFGGAVLFNVQNALAAAAMAHGAGVPLDGIRKGLRTFASTFEQNPGRMNVHEAHGFRVILDYAHNPEALRALGRAVAATKAPGTRSVAMISIPGDRREADIREMGAISAEMFDVLVFRETPDNRGRPAGEVVRLLTEGAVASGFDPRAIHPVREEEGAALHAMRLAAPGDTVVLTPTSVETIWSLVLGFQPSPAGPASTALMEPAHG